MSKRIPVPVPSGAKWCHQCQQLKPTQQFSVDRSKKDGRHYCCLRCAEGKLREYGERRRMLNATYRHVNGIG